MLESPCAIMPQIEINCLFGIVLHLRGGHFKLSVKRGDSVLTFALSQRNQFLKFSPRSCSENIAPGNSSAGHRSNGVGASRPGMMENATIVAAVLIKSAVFAFAKSALALMAI